MIKYKYLLPFLFLILVILGDSCTTNKNLNKSNIQETTSTNTETAITQTVTEQVDTTIQTKEVIAEASKELEKLIEGDSAFTDTPELTITTKVVKGQVKTTAKAKAQNTPVKINKTTVTVFNQKRSIKSKVVTRTKIVDKKGINWNWIWLLIALITALIAWKIGLLKKG